MSWISRLKRQIAFNHCPFAIDDLVHVQVVTTLVLGWAEKTSFQKFLQEVRAVLAVNYLSDERLKALDISMLLGYSSISSFTTAFKSWYDVPPAEYWE